VKASMKSRAFLVAADCAEADDGNIHKADMTQARTNRRSRIESMMITPMRSSTKGTKSTKSSWPPQYTLRALRALRGYSWLLCIGRDDDHAVRGDRQRVLDVDARQAVLGDDGPLVVQGFRLGLAHVEHRLDGEHQAGLELEIDLAQFL